MVNMVTRVDSRCYFFRLVQNTVFSELIGLIYQTFISRIFFIIVLTRVTLVMFFLFCRERLHCYVCSIS
jgi:hypothetical protein